MRDKAIYGIGCEKEFSINDFGGNNNEIVVGSTGSGKTTSIILPALCYSFNRSIVVPFTKFEIMEETKEMFKSRGYHIMYIDVIEPERSSIGYDPLRFIRSTEDVMRLARRVLEIANESKFGNDLFWTNSAIDLLAAILLLIRSDYPDEFKFGDALDVINDFTIYENSYGDGIKTIMDEMFSECEDEQVKTLWNGFRNTAFRTASSINITMKAATNKIATKSTIQLMKKNDFIDFSVLGKTKTVLYLRTSFQNPSLELITCLLYEDLFRELFQSAQNNKNYTLDIPVHVFFDDFACGSKVDDFDRQIALLRSAGISVTLLLQSETQLVGLYGYYKAKTIINNCDTYVYLGGNDIDTCKEIAERTNMRMNEIMNMPLGNLIVCRRGHVPVVTQRYPIFDDEIYVKCVQKIKRKDS